MRYLFPGLFHFRSGMKLAHRSSRGRALGSITAALIVLPLIVGNAPGPGSSDNPPSTLTYNSVELPHKYSGSITNNSCENPARGQGYRGDVWRINTTSLEAANNRISVYMMEGPVSGGLGDPFLQILDLGSLTAQGLPQERASNDDGGQDDNGDGRSYSSFINNATATNTSVVMATTFGPGATGTYTLYSTIPLTQETICPQVITFTQPANTTYGTSRTLSAVTNISGSIVSFESLTPETCSVTGTTATTLQVGTCEIRATQPGNGTTTAAAGPVTRSFSISPKQLTVTGLTASKMYDGNTAVSLSGTATLSGGLIGTDVVELSGTPSATFTTAGAGTNKPVTLSGLSLGGAQAANYSLSNQITGNISQRPVTAEFIGVPEKVYDEGSTINLGASDFALTNTILGDVVTMATVTGALDNPNAGTRQATVSSPALTGAAAGNYSIAGPVVGTVRVLQAEQAVVSVQADSEIPYESNLSLDSAGGSGDGAVSFSLQAGSPCTLSGGSLRATGNAGEECVVTVTKAESQNYLARTSAPLSILITPAAQPPLSLGGQTTVPHRERAVLTLAGGAGDGAVTIESPTEGCTILTNPFRLVASLDAGETCTLSYLKAGSTDGNFLSAASGPLAVTITKGPITIPLLDPVTRQSGTASQAIQVPLVFAGDGTTVAGQFTWTSSNPNAVRVVGNTLEFVRAGTAVVTGDFLPAQEGNFLTSFVSFTVTVTSPPPPRTPTQTIPEVIPPTTNILNIPRTPSPPAPGAIPPGTTSPPGPVQTPGGLAPPTNGAQTFVGGAPVPTQVQPLGDSGVRVTSGTVDLAIRTNQTGGGLAQNPTGQIPELNIPLGGTTLISGSGVQPNSPIRVFVAGPNDTFIPVADLLADATGAFQGEALLLSQQNNLPLPIGRQTLQIVGFDEEGRQTVTNMVVNVAQPVPQPELVLGEENVPSLQPGEYVATIAGVPTDVELIGIPEQNMAVIEGENWSMAVEVPADEGLLETGEDGELRLNLVRDESATVSGSGFMPFTRADVWLFSTPTLLGTVDIDENGEFNGSVNIDGKYISVGDHTLQLQGVGKDGYVRSANLGVIVNDSVDNTPVATAQRGLSIVLWSLAALGSAASVGLFVWLRRAGRDSGPATGK